MPRKEEIEAAVAAITSPDRAAIAARLLIAMFSEDNVCRRSRAALSAATGLPKNTIERWLAALLAAGVLSKRPPRGGDPSTYHLHLPPHEAAMRGPRAPAARPRRDDIEAAVADYDSANPTSRLPHHTARLLVTMFPADDVCQRSLEDLAGAASIERRSLTQTLHRLLEAGFLTKQPSYPTIYHLHLPPHQAAMRGPRAPTGLPRREDIAVAVAAYDSANPDEPLPPDTVRLLSVMFAEGDVCRRNLDSLLMKGLHKKKLILLLDRLVGVGFLSKGVRAGRGGTNSYHLHLPPVRP